MAGTDLVEQAIPAGAEATDAGAGHYALTGYAEPCSSRGRGRGPERPNSNEKGPHCAGPFTLAASNQHHADGHMRQRGVTLGRSRLARRNTKALAITSATRGFSWLGGLACN